MVTEPATQSGAFRAERWSYAEQRLYDRSPFNLWITTAIVLAALIGAFAVAASIDGVPWIVRDKTGPAFEHRAWLAICLTLIVCSSLGLQRYSRVMELKDAPEFYRAIQADVTWAPAFSKTRLRLFTVVGVIIGAGAMLLFLPSGAAGRTPAIVAWFSVVAVLLGALFFRGLELTGAGARHTRYVILSGLKIDLLRIEQLYPWGRAAARTALVWFTVSAATLLQFVGSTSRLYTIGLAVGSAAIGAWVFLGTLALIHHEIRKAKAAELERLRTEIDAVRRALDADPAAPAKLQSLLAFEARIDAAPEWPFDQTILIRVGASALILTVPWFGQALAGVMVEHLGKVLP